MNEEWRDIPGYEGKYQVNIDTPEGRCRSLNYNHTGEVKELANTPNSGRKKPRVYWNLAMGGRAKKYQAARWIALTYPELVQNEYFEGAEIDHIDGNPMNNHPSNLRWVTTKGNANDPVTIEERRKAGIGRIQTDETKRKISEWHKGRKRSVETKEKLKTYYATHQHPKGKWVIKLSINDEILHFYLSTRQAEKETGIDHKSICRVCNGKVKTAGGYKWKYAE